MTLSKDLQHDLRKLRASSARRFRELAGIDLDRVKTVGDEVGAEYQIQLQRVRDELAGAGERVAEEHSQWLRFNKRSVQQRFVQAIAQPRPSCLCLPIFAEDSTESHANSQCLGSCIENDAHLGPEPNTAHPRLEVHGPGPGESNVAEMTVQFDFDLEPGGDGEYCIAPVCQLSGHWLTWTWGTCSNVAAGSEAHVSVEKTVQVVQGFDDFEFPLVLAVGGPPVYSASHQVVDHIELEGGDSQSGFSFNGVPAFGVNLSGGNPVTVRIICRIQASVQGYGRAIVDMNTSPNFYFRTPEVRWGPTICMS